MTITLCLEVYGDKDGNCSTNLLRVRAVWSRVAPAGRDKEAQGVPEMPVTLLGHAATNSEPEGRTAKCRVSWSANKRGGNGSWTRLGTPVKSARRTCYPHKGRSWWGEGPQSVTPQDLRLLVGHNGPSHLIPYNAKVGRGQYGIPSAFADVDDRTSALAQVGQACRDSGNFHRLSPIVNEQFRNLSQVQRSRLEQGTLYGVHLGETDPRRVDHLVGCRQSATHAVGLPSGPPRPHGADRSAVAGHRPVRQAAS